MKSHLLIQLKSLYQSLLRNISATEAGSKLGRFWTLTSHSLVDNQVTLLTRHSLFVLFVLTLSGCASYGVVENRELSAQNSSLPYSLIDKIISMSDGEDYAVVLAFSGGGTRAAALAYGVLQALRDTTIRLHGKERRLLDDVAVISSVSGGSFTAAYYGLYGERIFDDFEDAFLRRNVQGSLIRGIFNPLQWFSRSGRTELAVKLYEKSVFHDATFSEMKKDGPLILINASDLLTGVRFSFAQEYFDLLCSDINSFPVARAVTASSAVPVLFNPVVLEDHQTCKTDEFPDWIQEAEVRAQDHPEVMQVVEGLKGYFTNRKRKYIHLVDGGITDNLGLRAYFEFVELTGGPGAYMRKFGKRPPRHLLMLVVNASTNTIGDMDQSTRSPTAHESLNAMSAVQLHRYNTATLELIKDSQQRWQKEELAATGNHTSYYLANLNFKAIDKPNLLQFINNIPTSFSLNDEQVDGLIRAGHELLRQNEEYQRFLSAIGGKVDR